MQSGTSPSSLCKRCKANVVNGLKCKICDSSFHLSCAKLHTTVKFTEDNGIICCADNPVMGPGQSDTAAFFEAIGDLRESEKVDIKIFKYVINQKDEIIKELRDKIELLNKQISLISSNHKCVTGQGDKKCLIKTNQNKIATNKETQKDTSVRSDKNLNAKQGNSNVSQKDIATTIMQEETKIKLNSYIHVNDDIEVSANNNNKANQPPSNEWRQVEKRKNRKRQLVIGNNTSNISIKGVPKYTSLHVYRVDKDTTTDGLTELLIQHFPEVTCEAMTPKHPNLYASFKVNIFQSNFRRAMDPALWPYGACIGRFLEMKPKVDLTTK